MAEKERIVVRTTTPLKCCGGTLQLFLIALTHFSQQESPSHHFDAAHFLVHITHCHTLLLFPHIFYYQRILLLCWCPSHLTLQLIKTVTTLDRSLPWKLPSIAAHWIFSHFWPLPINPRDFCALAHRTSTMSENSHRSVCYQQPCHVQSSFSRLSSPLSTCINALSSCWCEKLIRYLDHYNEQSSSQHYI